MAFARPAAVSALSADAGLGAALGPGRVLAAHRRACTLETDAGALLTIAAPELGNGPLTLLAPRLAWAAGERFEPAGPRRLRFERGPELEWASARAWSAADCAPSGWPAHRNAAALERALRALPVSEGLLPALLGAPPPLDRAGNQLDAVGGVSALQLGGDGNSLATPAGYPLAGAAAVAAQRALAGRAAPLLEALPAPAAARGLIGLGPGLTPAGDDLLAGLLLTLRCGGHPAAAPLAAALAEPATTRLARAMLGWAAAGLAGEHRLALLRGLFECAAPDWLALLPPVAAQGATSGADWLAGALIGLRLLEDHPAPPGAPGETPWKHQF